jgi:hypothetical protein
MKKCILQMKSCFIQKTCDLYGGNLTVSFRFQWVAQFNLNGETLVLSYTISKNGKSA